MLQMGVSVKLGDMQSVLQLTVALNTVFFSFREIRTPTLLKYAREYERTESAIADAKKLAAPVTKPETLSPFDDATKFYFMKSKYEFDLQLPELNLKELRNPYLDDLVYWDAALRVFALFVAACGFAGLFYCSANSDIETSVPTQSLGSRP